MRWESVGQWGKYSLMVTQEYPNAKWRPIRISMKTIVLLFVAVKKHSPLILKVLTEKLWVLQSAKRTLEMIAMPASASPFGSMHFTCFP